MLLEENATHAQFSRSSGEENVLQNVENLKSGLDNLVSVMNGHLHSMETVKNVQLILELLRATVNVHLHSDGTTMPGNVNQNVN